MGHPPQQFALFPEHDDAIAAWFETHGRPVTVRHYDFDRGVFAWRHEGSGVDSRTLRVTLTSLEDVPAHILVGFLESAKVWETLEKAPEKYALVRRNTQGGVLLDILDGPL